MPYAHHTQGKLFKGLHLCRLCPQHAGGREPSYHEYQLNPHVSPFCLFLPVKPFPPSTSLWTALHASRRSKVIRRERIWIFAFLIPCLSAFLWKVYSIGLTHGQWLYADIIRHTNNTRSALLTSAEIVQKELTVLWLTYICGIGRYDSIW